ncbi:MAG: 2-amino-4-hydroxy-6-hydroxymethyldihydropteridine diphosphokinase [Ornithinimicrobium sp.]
MNDQIELRGVSAFGRHGVLDSERRQGQHFSVDALLEVDTAAASASDEVGATVNYASVAADIVAIIAGPAVNLIETLAALIAEKVLTSYPLVQATTVTVHKPQAPVGVPFDDVLVRVTRQRSVAVTIGLGANLGAAEHTVRAALGGLSGIPAISGLRSSSLYRTAPVGGPEQDDYVNAVATAQTDLPPHALLGVLHGMEQAFGRTRDVRWGPRTLDLDLIQYGSPATRDETVLDEPDLVLPHPRTMERGFVLMPWLEVDPAASLTVAGHVVPVATLVTAVDVSGVRRIPGGEEGDELDG